jgi:hypothetical protein
MLIDAMMFPYNEAAIVASVIATGVPLTRFGEVKRITPVPKISDTSTTIKLSNGNVVLASCGAVG